MTVCTCVKNVLTYDLLQGAIIVTSTGAVKQYGVEPEPRLYCHCCIRVLQFRATFSLTITAHRKILVGANHEPFIHRYMETYMAYALTVAYSPNFSSPIAFTCMVCQISPTKYFPWYLTYANDPTW